MKKIAILIYPEFSIKEISDVMYLFRWGFDAKTVILSSSMTPVLSEEGVSVLPQKTLSDFNKEDYHCLVLPGCSDFREALRDTKLFDFLKDFKDENEFPIGAICGGPLFLSMAGLLDEKKFTNALYYEMNQLYQCINMDNLVFSPLVEDGNIVTAVGNNTRRFAIKLARKAGMECSDNALKEVSESWEPEDFKYHLDQEQLDFFKKNYAEYLIS